MAITPGRWRADAFDLDWLYELAEDGVDTVQIREKHLTDGDLLHLVQRIVERGVGPVAGRGRDRLRVVVNGRADVASLAGAAGVHLPGRGVPTSSVLRRFPGLLVGRSTHHIHEVAAAARDGAHYVTFSPIRATPSKRRFGPPQGFDGLRQAVRAADDLPVVALGGLDGDDVGAVRAAGARGLAGIRVFQSTDARQRLLGAWQGAES